MNNATIRSSLLILISFISWNFLQCQIVNSVPYEKINPELLTWHWEASWITHPSESVMDYGVFHFRKSFTLDKKPDGFIIHISADNRYRLFVNGTPSFCKRHTCLLRTCTRGSQTLVL